MCLSMYIYQITSQTDLILIDQLINNFTGMMTRFDLMVPWYLKQIQNQQGIPVCYRYMVSPPEPHFLMKTSPEIGFLALI